MKDLKIFFFIKKDKKNSEGLTAIYGKISYLDSSTTYSTGLVIKASDWKKTKQLSKPKTQDEEDLQKERDRQKNTIKRFKEILELQEKPITANILKDLLLERKTTKEVIVPKIMLKTVMKELIAEKVALVSVGRRAKGTLTKYYTTEKHLDNFLESSRNIKDIALDDLNYKFIKDFYHYLLNEKMVNGKKENRICNNVCQKYVQTLRCSVFFAIKMDYILGDPFKNYVYEWDELETVYLTKAELARVEKHEFQNKRLDVVRDIFLFSCYTGYAPIDLKYITQESIELRDDNKYWFNVNRKKTNTVSDVMVFKKTFALIEKYAEDPFCKANNMLLPMRANQTMNEYLKEVAHHCGINKNLTHYVARHTFATTVMLRNGASMEVLGGAMGHKRATQTAHYGKIVDARSSSEMQKVDENMNEASTPDKKPNVLKDVSDQAPGKIIKLEDFTEIIEESEKKPTKTERRRKKLG